MSDKLPFTQEQIIVATFRMTLENNALLRIAITNQVAIMDKLNIEIDPPTNAYADLVPGMKADDLNPSSLFFRTSEVMTELLQKRAWEWLQLNNKDTE